MARKSIESRMSRIVDRLLPPGSIERRLWDCPELAEAWRLHQAKTAAIIDRMVKIRGEGSAFEALCEGELIFPPMPEDLAAALGLPPAPRFTADMSVAECARLWDAFRDGEEQ